MIFSLFARAGSGLFIAALCLASTENRAPVHAAAPPHARQAGVFLPTKPNRAAPRRTSPTGMAWIPGGEFSMGCADPRSLPEGGHEAMDDARPIHRVYVDGFWMDKTDVTNTQFAKFVKATGYVTVAERKPSAKDFPGVPVEKLVPGSLVFTPPLILYLLTTLRNGGVMSLEPIGGILLVPEAISLVEETSP